MSGSIPDSRAPGYLLPTSPSFLTMDQTLQRWIVGVTGLPGSLVRPRWQPAPAPEPDQGVNWCAVGYNSGNSDAQAFIRHDPEGAGGLGTSTVYYHVHIEVIATFYGPQADDNATNLNTGAFLSQNRDILAANNLMLVDVGIARVVPELINQIWVRRVDVFFELRQQVESTYQVRTLLDFPVKQINDPT